MKNKLKILVSCLFFIGLLSFLPTVKAAPGDLDSTFSQDGKLYDFLLFGGEDYAFGTAIQSDGKIVAVGQLSFGNVRSCGLSRYNTDGSLDPTFDGDGKVVMPNGREFVCVAVAIQADGRIVAAGRIGNANNLSNDDFAVIRLNTDGSLDTSFDSDGLVVTAIGSGDDEAEAVAIQPDGKIVVAGMRFASSSNFALVRYNTDGSLDTSFDGDGRVTAPVGERAYSVAIQSDGKIVAAGSGRDGVTRVFAFARYNTNGSLDTSFDTDGQVLISVDNSTSARDSSARDMAIQADGKIVAAGYCTVTTGSGNPAPQNREFALVRLNTDGSLDTSFDSDGKVITTMSGTNESANALAIQTDGKIVIAGFTSEMSPQDNEDFALVRYNPDGSLDTSFDGDGKVVTVVGVIDDAAHAVAIQTDGRIVAAGSNFMNGLSTDDFALVRYNTDGSLDPTFSSNGMTNHDVGFRQSFGRAIAMQPNGKFVVAGFTYNGDWEFGVIKYNADGTADTSFDGDGKVSTDVLPGADEARAVAVQADGKVVVAGTAGFPFNQPLSNDAAVLRYNTDGSLDTTFDSDGKALIDRGVYDFANAVAIQPDGKIVVAGYIAPPGGDFNIMLIRLNTDGSLDTSFDSDGTVIVSGLSSDQIYALAIQPDGKIVAAGQLYNGSNLDILVVRYNSDGSPDTSFDADGLVTTPVLSADDGAKALALQTDGKIVVTGFSNNGANNDFAVVRYNPNGSLDTSFDGDGKLTTPLLTADEANAVTIQANGKIIAAGTTNNSNTINTSVGNEFAMVRYNPDGSLDSTFNADGKLVFDFWGASDDRLYAMALDANGRALVVGDASDNFAVARVLGDFVPNAKAPFDFDGDGKTDIGIFRPSDGSWWYSRSSDNGFRVYSFGVSSDIITPSDFTGDGKADIAVFRPASGEWFIQRSDDNSFFSFPFGASGDVPAPSDYDGDGKTDAAVFRPSTGTWFIQNSGGSGTSIVNFGSPADKPVPADFDGDRKADIAIFRPSDGSWWYLRSSDSQFRVFRFGLGTDKPVQGDYSGDGKADLAVFRESTGEWYFQRSEDNSYYSVPFGAAGDLAAPGDYDGDGRFDTAVFRPSTANWFVNRSTAGILITNFGTSGDRPIPNAFLP